MRIFCLLILHSYYKSCLSSYTNHTNEISSNNWQQKQHFDNYSHPTYAEVPQYSQIKWPEENFNDDGNEEIWFEETTTDRYHIPAVMEGGLLRAQIPQHTLIAIDRFLKILKSLAGFAILLAIGMPFIHEITSSLFEETIKYLF